MFALLSMVMTSYWLSPMAEPCSTLPQTQLVDSSAISAAEAATRKKEIDLQKQINELTRQLGGFGRGEESEKAIRELLKIQKQNKYSIAGPQIPPDVRKWRAAKIGMTLGNSHMGDAAQLRGEDRQYEFEKRYKDALELANSIEDETQENVWQYVFLEAVGGNTRPHAFHVLSLVKAANGRGIDEVRRVMDLYIEKAQDPKYRTDKFFLPHGENNFGIFHGLLLTHGKDEDVERLRKYAKVHEVRKQQELAREARIDALYLHHRLWVARASKHLTSRDTQSAVAELRSFQNEIKKGTYEPFESDPKLDPEGLFLNALINTQSVLGFEPLKEFEDDIINSFETSEDHISLKIEFLATQETLKRKKSSTPNARSLNLLLNYEKGEIESSEGAINYGRNAQKKLRELRQLQGNPLL
jgi:hypothetical protein